MVKILDIYYVEMMLVADDKECELYFTTDGQPPSLSSGCRDELQRTFKYRGPFQLHPGSRTLMAVAVNWY